MTEAGEISLSVYVQPGAKRTEFAGVHGEALKIRLAAPPVDGRANACLIEFIADFCHLPKREVYLLSGDCARQKVLRIASDCPALIARFEAAAK